MTVQAIAWAGKVRKALVAAASVLVALSASEGVPANWQQWIGTALAVLATFGIVHQVPNKPSV